MQLLSILEPAIGLIIWQLAIIIAFILPTIFAVVNIAMNKFEENKQIFWLLIAIFVPFGSYIYFIIGRKNIVRSV
jgi:hypothetical protein